VASQYRLDDLSLESSAEGGAAIDFSSGIEIEGTGSGDEPGPGPDPVVKDPIEISLSGFLAAEASDDQPYSLTGTVKSISDETAGALVLTDGITDVNVLSLTATDLGFGAGPDGNFASLDVKVGNKINIIGYRQDVGPIQACAYAYLVKNYGTPEPKTVSFAIKDSKADDWTKDTEESNGGYEILKDGLAYGYYKNKGASAVAAPYLESDPAHIRIVKYGLLKIVPPAGCVVTKVVMKITGANYMKEPDADGGSFELDNDSLTMTWTGSSSVFVAVCNEGQVRVSEFTVTYE